MSKAPESIAQTLLRIGERVTQLVGKHLQLVRLEVEDEAKVVARRLGKQAKAVGIAAPPIIAGVVLVSLGIATLVALLLRPLMGNWSFPLSFIVLGLLLSLLCLRWLVDTLRALDSAQHQALDNTRETGLGAGNGNGTQIHPFAAEPLASQSENEKAPSRQQPDFESAEELKQNSPGHRGAEGTRNQKQQAKGGGPSAQNSKQKANLRTQDIHLHMDSPPRPELPTLAQEQPHATPTKAASTENPAARSGNAHETHPPL